MPRRFLATRQKAVSAVEDRLRSALVYEIKRPSEGEGEQFPFACYVHSQLSLSLSLCLVVITCFLSRSSLSSNLRSSLSSTITTAHCCLSYLSLSLSLFLSRVRRVDRFSGSEAPTSQSLSQFLLCPALQTRCSVSRTPLASRKFLPSRANSLHREPFR